MASKGEGRGFSADILNASLTLLSILVAVITILTVEYKTHPSFAYPVLIAVVSSTVVAFMPFVR